MILVFEGDNQSLILSEISNIKKKFNPNNIYEFEGCNKNITSIRNALSSTSMFADKTLVIIKVTANESVTDDIVLYNDDENRTIVLYGTLNARFKENKELKKIAKLTRYEKKDAAENFSLCDAIFFKRNKKDAITIINSYPDIDNEFYALLPLMQTYLRNLISKKYQNKYWEGLNPYFRSKFAKSADVFSEEELKNLYTKILDLDVKSKSSGSKSPKALLQDFVIYSI